MTTPIKVKITNGDVGPSVLPKHWRYRPFQRRNYSDGLVMLLEENDGAWGTLKVRATVWIWDDGLNGGSHGRVVNSPSDIGALVRGFRNGLRELGLYGDHGLWDADGRRLEIGARP